MGASEAKTIRGNLKAAGYNQKYVSVRSNSYSMGSSVRVEVKDPTADFKLIERIAKGEESYSRCESSGEILSGGNTFVFVSYSQEAEQTMGAPYVDRIRVAFEKVEGNTLQPIEGTDYLVGDGGVNDLTLWNKETSGMTASVWMGGNDFEPAARKLAKLIKADNEA